MEKFPWHIGKEKKQVKELCIWFKSCKKKKPWLYISICVNGENKWLKDTQQIANNGEENGTEVEWENEGGLYSASTAYLTFKKQKSTCILPLQCKRKCNF